MRCRDPLAALLEDRIMLLSACSFGLGLVGLLGWQAKEGGEAGKAAEAVAEAERAKARDAANRGARAREQAEELAGFLLEDLRRELMPLGRAGVLAAAATTPQLTRGTSPSPWSPRSRTTRPCPS